MDEVDHIDAQWDTTFTGMEGRIQQWEAERAAERAAKRMR